MITIDIHNYSIDASLPDIANMLQAFVEKVEMLERKRNELKSINDQYYDRIKELEGIIHGKSTGSEQESGSK